MASFNDKVYREIENQGGNSRFPCPVSLCYSGEATKAAERLGISKYDEEAIHKAVKELQKAGRVKLVYRYGYTWVVPSWMSTPPNSEVLETPTDFFGNWQAL